MKVLIFDDRRREAEDLARMIRQIDLAVQPVMVFEEELAKKAACEEDIHLILIGIKAHPADFDRQMERLHQMQRVFQFYSKRIVAVADREQVVSAFRFAGNLGGLLLRPVRTEENRQKLEYFLRMQQHFFREREKWVSEREPLPLSFPLEEDGRMRMLRPSELILVQKNSRQYTLHFVEGCLTLDARKCRDLTSRLRELGFLSISRWEIVNPVWIEAVRRNQLYLKYIQEPILLTKSGVEILRSWKKSCAD